MVKKEEIQKETLNYFKGDQLATDVFINKYALRDKKGNFHEKSPEDMHRRLASEFARIEAKYPNGLDEEGIFMLLDKFRYIIPQGSPMAGIGNDFQVTTLSNCYVIESPYDSYSGIFKTEQEMIQLMKRRGGVGFSIHSLRPKEMPTGSVSTKSSGIVLFSERYSNGTREVAQDGRRGALMLSCSVNHPDVEDFIDAKLDLKKITGANISVMITDEFMSAVRSNTDYEVSFSSEKGEVRKRLNAKKIWDKIIKNAWASAEPGVLYWDTILNNSPLKGYGEEWRETSTNPCAEIPLCPYDSCRLLALNLYSYVDNPFEGADRSRFNFDLFKHHVRIGQRLMDDIVDLEIEKIQRILDMIEFDSDPTDLKKAEYDVWNKILDKTKRGRRTGLGITGLGDALAALNLTYGTEQATNMIEQIIKDLSIESYVSSIILAKERGSFPEWSVSKDRESPYIQDTKERLDIYYPDILDMYYSYGRRNIANLTIAPTGSVSTLTQTTSGIEPAFSIYYKRRRKTNDRSKTTFIDTIGDWWEEYNVFHHKFIEWYDKNWYKTDCKLFDLDYKKPLEDYSDEQLSQLISKSPYYKATANDVDWLEKVRMQGVAQQYIDHSISVTVNVPNNTTIETVNEIYLRGWESGCKGMTIYRDGCRSGVLVSANEDKKSSIKYIDAVKRPKILECDIYHKVGGGEKWLIIVGLLDNKPYEIFALPDPENSIFPSKIDRGRLIKVKSQHYKLEGDYGNKTYSIQNIVNRMSLQAQNDTRKYSIQLRHGIKPLFISEQIDKFAVINGFDKVIGKVLGLYATGERAKDKCPECGSQLSYQDGCVKCINCGFSLCG